MQYLVDMKLSAYGRPTGGPQDGISFIEQFILPSLELCKKLEAEKKILAGGTAIGAIRTVIIRKGEGSQEDGGLVGERAILPQMETTVTPLTSFNDRMIALRPRLEHLKAKSQNGPTAAI